MSSSVKSDESKDSKTVDKESLLDIDPAYEKKVVRKLDFCLIPLMTMFYLLSFLVRTNALLKIHTLILLLRTGQI